MERLNRTTAPQAKTYTEKVIQFGEGNFLRAFIEWIIWKTNQKTDFDASVVIVQPIDRGMVDMLNELTKMPVPAPLAGLKGKKARFSDVTEVDAMPEYVLSALNIG